MSERALVFGAGGFVGQYLVRELAFHGYEVIGSDRGGSASSSVVSAFCQVDVLDAARVSEICQEYEPGVIVNLAAISSVGASWRDPRATVQVNVIGAINILEAARSLGGQPKVLLVGSSEEYAPSDKPLGENDAIDASNPYGISKAGQGGFAELYAKRFGLRVYRTRSFNHTGVGQSLEFVLPSWCKQIADIEQKGGPGVLKVGNTQVWRDFSDVRDVVSAYRLLIESDCWGEVFNIGSGRAVKLGDLASHVANLSSCDIEIEVDPDLLRPVENAFICCDKAKAREKLGWEPRFAIEETLADMFGSYLRGVDWEDWASK